MLNRENRTRVLGRCSYARSTITRGTRMRRPMVPMLSCSAAARALQLSKSNSWNCSSTALATPWYRSVKALRTEVMWTG